MEYCDKCGYIKQQCECDKAEDIKLYKRSTVERLAIANTLIDGVRQELKNDLLTTALDKCMVDITACIDLLGIPKGD